MLLVVRLTAALIVVANLANMYQSFQLESTFLPLATYKHPTKHLQHVMVIIVLLILFTVSRPGELALSAGWDDALKWKDIDVYLCYREDEGLYVVVDVTIRNLKGLRLNPTAYKKQPVYLDKDLGYAMDPAFLVVTLAIQDGVLVGVDSWPALLGVNTGDFLAEAVEPAPGTADPYHLKLLTAQDKQDTFVLRTFKRCKNSSTWAWDNKAALTTRQATGSTLSTESMQQHCTLSATLPKQSAHNAATWHRLHAAASIPNCNSAAVLQRSSDAGRTQPCFLTFISLPDNPFTLQSQQHPPRTMLRASMSGVERDGRG
ncbi:uncharacterized protein PSFLO_07403 [Pseudozyma flocculosa]|uniref:Uncharacterized protein n=1 Tax=Pseudozyma flocculosa TaxID=84751 RepID=A0A5C3FCC0_9BASI|nr:uncharacterized protein PSFLO_07403 [Pseudozyma flocculosa]